MLSKSELGGFIAGAKGAGYLVYAPQKREGKVYLEEIADPDDLVIDHVLTVNGVKDILLPRCEPLAEFNLYEVRVDAVEAPAARRVLFATRPCDAASLVILDAILLDPARDTRYARMREETVIVTVACSRADSACFCTSMGYGPHDETGSDVILLPAGGAYMVRALTGKGESLIRELGIAEDGDGETDSPPELARRVGTDGLKDWLDENFDSGKWHDVSINCISCGTCYYLCPTCHCFDIVDEAGVSKGCRYRIWDCCSFSDFTRMAGHQPRVGRHARYRQRIMHKFKYTVDNVNLTACVGDGRCIRHCPVGVDIGEILESLPAGGRAPAGKPGPVAGED
jgi:sulfhydrogenase subunit beta (sulfur reductase)